MITAVDINPTAYGVRIGVASSASTSVLLGVIDTTTAVVEREIEQTQNNDEMKSKTTNDITTELKTNTLKKFTRNDSGSTTLIRKRSYNETYNDNTLLSLTRTTRTYTNDMNQLCNTSGVAVAQPASKTTQTIRKNTNRIAFGSCNEQNYKNRLWNIIQQRKPNAFIWGGDAIYAGTFLFGCLYFMVAKPN
jgi:hypothetical protein